MCVAVKCTSCARKTSSILLTLCTWVRCGRWWWTCDSCCAYVDTLKTRNWLIKMINPFLNLTCERKRESSSPLLVTVANTILNLTSTQMLYCEQAQFHHSLKAFCTHLFPCSYGWRTLSVLLHPVSKLTKPRDVSSDFIMFSSSHSFTGTFFNQQRLSHLHNRTRCLCSGRQGITQGAVWRNCGDTAYTAPPPPRQSVLVVVTFGTWLTVGARTQSALQFCNDVDSITYF